MLLIMAYNFALHISLASIAIDFVLAVASLLTGTSSSNCAFAVDCALDVFSSAILVWRFYGETSESSGRVFTSATTPMNLSRRHNYYQSLTLSDNHQSSSHRKELIACIGLGIMFIVSGVIVIVKSAFDLAVAEVNGHLEDLEPDMKGMPGILHVTSVAFVICSLLALGKYVLYKQMDSKAMLLECINSWISAVFALVIVISTVIIEYDNSLWVLDPIISIVFSVFMIIYGIFNIIKNQNKLNDYNNCNFVKKKLEYIIIP